MKTNTTIRIALAALFTSSLAFADTEVSGKLTIEHAALVSQDAFTSLKDDISIRLYADGDVMDGVTYHAEIQAQSDSTKVGGYTGEYTQNAGIRELYTDIEAGDGWAARLGKQQVVWGTADGMKLLDIINPTDYSEMAQNQMEDSRIPVWALNLEAGSVQVVISEPKENVFAGLNRGTELGIRSNNPDGSDKIYAGTDEGSAFMMMGPDSITGRKNGFLNIAPDLGSIAAGFGGAFTMLGSPATDLGGLGNPGMNDLLSAFTVGAFTAPGATLGGLSTQFFNMQVGKYMANGMSQASAAAISIGFRDLNFAAAVGAMACADSSTGQNVVDQLGAGTCADDGSGGYTGATAATDYDAVAGTFTGTAILNGWSAGYDSNLSSFGDGVQDSAFEYMTDTGFRTFDTFVNARSQYIYSMPESDDVDFAIKTSQSTKSGLNYSVNFSNSYDKNPIIDLSWRNDANEILTQTVVDASLTMAGQDVIYGTYLELTDADGNVYGGLTGKSAILTFDQSVNRTTNLGGSFDTTIETAGLGPVVVRGEVLYTQDGSQPVMSLSKLSQGDLIGALTMQKADRFKFVLGADITVLTNMMISGQYISDRNLDFKDSATEYTTDYATMHLSNGFNKAIEDKQFYSLFFSKPFGESGQHRWNNITMVEEGVSEDAYWNRFDVDYGLTDDMQATVELNNYWGNYDTQFGQLKGASNMQVGVKYSF